MSTPTWTGPNWRDAIERHRANYAKEERSDIDKARRMYRGKAWSKSDENAAGKMNLVTFNLLFAIIETATAATVPPNLAFTVYEKPTAKATEWEKFLELAGRMGDWRGEACLSMVDAMLTGRSVLKTTPGPDGLPQIRAVDPRQVYFDLSVRRPTDISYFIELCPMTKADFKAKLEKRPNGRKPVYRLPQGVSIENLTGAYPEQLSNDANKTAGDDWIEVYEVVDVRRRVVSHWLASDGINEPLGVWEGDDYYNPYSLFNLNLNGQDCRGLSEVLLVEDVVLAINRLLVYWSEIVRRQVPFTLYSDEIEETEVVRVQAAPVGAWVKIKANGKPLSSLIYQPTPAQVPPDLINFMRKLEEVVAFVTAMSDMARGQVVGAKTATELAVIESKDKTRLNHRVARFYSAWEDAARKAIALGKVSNSDWPDPYLVQMEAYSAMGVSREVIRERVIQALPLMEGKPGRFNQRAVDKAFVEVMGLPSDVLASDEEVAAMAQPATESPEMAKIAESGAQEAAKLEQDPSLGAIPTQATNRIDAAQGIA